MKLLLTFVLPDTFNVDRKVTPLFNVVLPDTFNDDTNVVLKYYLITLLNQKQIMMKLMS